MALHKTLPFSEIHKAHSLEYANQTAREAASGLTSDDIGRIARQTDNSSFWVLTNNSPLTWSEVTNISVSDHGALAGLGDDDHTQYLNETRHDALPADNPHNVTAAQAGADPAGSAAAVQSNLTTHVNNVSNPHSTKASQVGVSTPLTAEVSAERSTSSTSFVDVTGVSVTFTPLAGERVLVIADGHIQSSGTSGERAEVDIAQNNSGSFVRLGGSRGSVFIESEFSAQDWPWSFSRVLTLPNAVSTTVKLQFRTSDGGETATMLGQVSPIVLHVVRLGV